MPEALFHRSLGSYKGLTLGTFAVNDPAGIDVVTVGNGSPQNDSVSIIREDVGISVSWRRLLLVVLLCLFQLCGGQRRMGDNYYLITCSIYFQSF